MIEMEALYQLQFITTEQWQSVPKVDVWLFETQSMTERLERYCHQVTVKRVREGYCTVKSLLNHEQQTLRAQIAQVYWRREVVLYGDNQAWLLGRTILPITENFSLPQHISQLGETPLGRQLFTDPTLTRDFIEPGKSGALYGRRSLLRVSQQPLLLTELFLADAPMYLPR